MNLEALIKNALTKKRMYQRELADLLDIQPATLNRYIKGRDTLPEKYMTIISKELDIEMDDLEKAAEPSAMYETKHDKDEDLIEIIKQQSINEGILIENEKSLIDTINKLVNQLINQK